MDLCDINVIKVLLAKHGFSFSKGLGQNFLRDPSVPFEIADGADIDENTCVLEVGPGIGTLTCRLCERAKKVVAVELDKRLPDILSDTLSEFDNVEIVSGDILKTDIPTLVAERFPEGCRAVACANLPYYITTPAVMALVESGCFETITVMVQREVALRMCAAPGSADYGAITPYILYYSRPEMIMEVGRDCFIPAPKVDSAVVRLNMRKEPPVRADKDIFFKVVRGAFAQRRKTLLNCLASAFPDLTKEEVRAKIEACGLSPSCRGETLGMEQFDALAAEFGS